MCQWMLFRRRKRSVAVSINSSRRVMGKSIGVTELIIGSTAACVVSYKHRSNRRHVAIGVQTYRKHCDWLHLRASSTGSHDIRSLP